MGHAHERPSREERTSARDPDTSRDLDLIPTIPQLTRILASTKKGRAFGEDRISPTLLATFPMQLSALLHPLITKVTTQISEPVQWRGGMLAYFPKPGKNDGNCSSQREVVLSDTFGKAYHKFRRQKLLESMRAKFRPTQFGGIPKKSTAMASLLLRMQMENCRRMGLSVAACFVDVVSAFYSVRRSLIVKGQGGGSASGSHEMFTSVLQYFGSTEHMMAAVEKAMEANWFTLAGMDSVWTFNHGLLPGDPQSDILFVALMTAILGDIHRQMTNENLGPPEFTPAERVWSREHPQHLTNPTSLSSTMPCFSQQVMPVRSHGSLPV